MRPSGTYIIPAIHPASFFRNQTLAFTGIEDWKKAVRVQREGATLIHPPIERWQWEPKLCDVTRYFDTMYDDGLMPGALADPGPWSFDFEATLQRQVVCLALWSCDDPTQHKGICIPFLCQGGKRYWAPADELKVMSLLNDFFTDPIRGKVGHNIVGYDAGYPPFNKEQLIKLSWGINVQGIIGDTFVAHHTCFSELRHKLAVLASIGTDLGPYKLELWENDDDDDDDDDDKDANNFAYILERPDVKTRTYCLKDAFVPALVWSQLAQEMAP